MAEPRRLYLLDASNYVYRAFHSTNPRDGGFSQSLSTSKGMPTNAILVFTNMLRKLVREHKPTHFAAVYDPPKVRSFRFDEYPEYKANRSATPDDLKVQMPYMRPLTQALGLTVVEQPGYEADDVIATLALEASKQGWDTVIVSSDKDMYQLLDDNVRMYDGMKDRWIDLAAVDKKFGVLPEKVAEVQALIGDTSDNIPGVPGVGPKTASKLITKYGTLEGIYEHIEEQKGKLKERLIDNKESAFLSRKLTTLLTDAPVSLDFEAMVVGDTDHSVLLPLFQELEFKGLLRDYQKTARPVVTVTRHEVTDATGLEALATALNAAPTFALEVLRDGSDYIRGRIVGLAFMAGNHSWYVPIAHRYLGAPDQLPQDAVLAAVGPALAAADKKRLVHGRKEASLTLRRAGLPRLAVDLDVEIVSYLVDATKYEHSLENIALDHLESKLPAAPNEIARGRESWEQGTVSEARDYALARVEAIYAVAPILLTDLKAGAKGSISRLEELYRQVELPLSDVLADVESAGIRIDPSVMQALSREFGEKATRMERTCHELAGGPFNVGSPKQLSDVLFNRLGLPVIKKTKTGASTDASVLDQLLDQHEIVPTILQWRSITKLKGTYTDVLPTLINPETKRIHTNFRQALAATGRLSSFDPNLQNIPSRTEEGRRIREAFVPAEGCVLLSADYSQIELRLLAHLSGDPGLTAAFRDREDIHTRTAAEVFGLKTDEVTRDQRSAAKAINFGLMYGMSAFRLARDLHITRPEAQSYMDRYFERYASVKNYIDETLQFGRDNGYVETLLGRRRYVPELTSRNFTRRGAAERAAMNMPVQGTAADVIKLAMLRVQSALREQGLKATMLLQVHDELVFDVPHDELEVVTKLVVDRMETAYPISVPMDVSVSSGPNWNEAH